MKEKTAAANKILTKISSNYSLILSHIDSFSSSGSLLYPNVFNFYSIFSLLKPFSGFVSKSL